MIEVDRDLTDEERRLLLALTIRNIADECRCSHGVAADVVARLVDEGKVEISGDARVAQVRACGHLRVEVERDFWLSTPSFRAMT